MSFQRHIQIVDEDEFTRHTLRVILEAAGYKCFESATHADFLEEMGAVVALPDLIIMEILEAGVPVGFETFQELLDDERLRDIPVMFFTGLTEKDDVLHGLSLASCYVPKPLDSDEIMKSVRWVFKTIYSDPSAD